MRSSLLRLTSILALFAVLAAGGLSGCTRGKQAAPTAQSTQSSSTAQPTQDASQADKSPGFPLTVVDGMKREVRLVSKPGRIVSLIPAGTEILFALGAGDRVVGVTKFCNYPAEALQKDKVGDYSNPSIEVIASLKPHLVVGDFIHPELADRLESMGFPVFLTNSQSVADTVQAIRLIGRAIGEDKAAETLASGMESRVAAIRAKVGSIPESSRPKVFHEMWNEPLMTSGPGTIMDDLIRQAGGINVAGDAKTLYPEYSLEALIAKNPDVIVYTYHNDLGKSRGNRWAGIKAVKEGRVHLLVDDLVSRPGPRIIEGLEDLAKRIHPDLFR